MQKPGLPMTKAFFLRNADDVALDLIGSIITVDGVGGKIVETEAYDESDCAAHCFNPDEPNRSWRTALNNSMFLAGGHAYVCPGRHLLHLNLVCGAENSASAVLIRALEPLADSVARMTERRGPNLKKPVRETSLCKGPGCLSEALGISCGHDGKSLLAAPFALYERVESLEVYRRSRIRARNNLKRRYIIKSRYISEPMPDAECVRQAA